MISARILASVRFFPLFLSDMSSVPFLMYIEFDYIMRVSKWQRGDRL
jgi:hypothetical protein